VTSPLDNLDPRETRMLVDLYALDLHLPKGFEVFRPRVSEGRASGVIHPGVR
jgi:hypothetical protein